MAQLFSGQSRTKFGDGRFDDSQWFKGPAGSPILRGAALALDCSVVHHHISGTHAIIIGSIEWLDLSWLDKSVRPAVLGYAEGNFGEWSRLPDEAPQ